MNYQVGDLFYASWDENSWFLLTEKPEENVYVITCMRTYKFYGYSKKGLESNFRKAS